MTSRRISLIHSLSMFQTSSESPEQASLYQSSSSSKPPIFTSCHTISAGRNSPPKQVPSTSTKRSIKGTRSSSICVPSQSYQKSDRRSCSIDGVAPNKRLSLSTQGSHEKMERKPSFVQVTERKLSVANISEQFSTFISLSSKMGVQVKITLFLSSYDGLISGCQTRSVRHSDITKLYQS